MAEIKYKLRKEDQVQVVAGKDKVRCISTGNCQIGIRIFHRDRCIFRQNTRQTIDPKTGSSRFYIHRACGKLIP